MSIFQGLYGYEQVMLGLGILLFLVLLFILLRCVVKDKPWGKVAGFFLLPILMIGFPSIQKVSYDDGKISLEKATHDLSDDPTDTASRQQVEAGMQKLRMRGGNDPSTLVTLAGAHWALGNYDSSQQLTEEALRLSPTDTTVRSQLAVLQGKIAIHNQFRENVDRLNGYLDRIQAGDKSEALAQSMVSILDTLKKPTYISEKDALTISKTYVALNRPGKALQIANQIIQSGTAGDSVVKFRQSLLQGTGGVNSEKLPESVLATKVVREVPIEKSIIVHRPLTVVKK